MKNRFIFLLVLAFGGLIDATYLTYEHYARLIPPCQIVKIFFILINCENVLQSKYAVIFGIPVALLGLIHYLLLVLLVLFGRNKLFRIWFFLQTSAGVAISIYLMYLQLFVLKSICIYCTISALISFSLFTLSFLWLESERKVLHIYFNSFIYRNFLKRIFFLINPEIIHEFMLNFGNLLEKNSLLTKFIKYSVRIDDASLTQKVSGISFSNPLGLAAGFDYEAKLTQILTSLGFGFGTVGTITNLPYEGNPAPMLGRLPKSKSLMVNKGFKNAGAKEIISRLTDVNFEMPIGISIGQTNSQKFKTQKQGVADIISAFTLFEQSRVKNAYYELNISCPNLFSKISFYPKANLKELLGEIEKLRVQKPIFIKMPIDKSDKETLGMLNVIAKFKIAGVIFGNLQKNRNDPALVQDEVKKFKVGNFSGKPTEKRSNELIKLAYKYFNKRFVIIGCGGIFCAQDAYRKIKLGARLVQLITGLIYEGPQLVAQINYELIDLIKKDGFKNVSEAVGIV